MRKSWLIAAVIGGAAGAAQAADVQLFGIHVPQTNDFAVYARISNSASVAPQPGLETVAGISSIAIDVLNNGAATVTSAQNTLPVGTHNDATALDPRYGFWVFRPPNPTVSGTGATDIRAGQFAEYDPADAAKYDPFVLQGVGLTSGSKPAGGAIVTPTSWSFPVLVAKGEYNGDAGTTGLTLQYTPGTGVNLLRDTDPTAAVGFSGADPNAVRVEGAASSTVVDAKTHTTGTLTPGTTTTKAGLGDANLDGVVDFIDLVALAQNYDSQGRSWFQGDFDLNGEVGFTDLVALAQNYEKPIPAVGTFSASFDAEVQRAFAEVPEPGMLSVVGVAMMMIGARRRRG